MDYLRGGKSNTDINEDIVDLIFGSVKFGQIKPDESFFVLFIILLYKRKCIKGPFKLYDKNLLIDTEKNVNDYCGQYSTQLREIYNIFQKNIEKAENNLISKILGILDTISPETLNEGFSHIFDQLLYRLIHWQGRRIGEFVEPEGLSKSICNIIELPNNAKVYNPFAGFASFGVFLEPEINYVGQEIDRKAWAIGFMRLMAHDRLNNSSYLHGDSIKDWNPENAKYDLVIAHLPYLKHEKYKKTYDTNSQLMLPIIEERDDAEAFFFSKLNDTLVENGKAIVVIGNHFFSQLRHKTTRKKLIDQDLIEAIIELPNNFQYFTIPVSLLVFNKQKKRKNEVLFINASKYDHDEKDFKAFFNAAKVKSLLKNKTKTNKTILVAAETIEKSDYNLVENIYYIDRFEGIPLMNFAQTIHGERMPGFTKGKIVTMNELKKNPGNCLLNINELKEDIVPSAYRKIEESCLLLDTRMGKLNPTYFKYAGEPIFIWHRIIPLKIDKEKVDFSFLANEFYTDHVKRQIAEIIGERRFSDISYHELGRIKFILPGLSEQRAKIQGAREAYLNRRAEYLRLEDELLGLKESTFRDLASIRHSLRQYLNALKTNISGTKKFFNKNKGENISLNTIYSYNLNRTLEDQFNSLERTVNSMGELIKLIGDKEKDSGPVKIHNLETLLRDAQLQSANTEIFEFEELFFDNESFQIDEESREPTIQISESDFFLVFSNIISNAVEHGFKIEGKANVIRTTLAYNPEDEMCVLEISNNGKPFPKTFGLKRLITLGEKTSDSKGLGIGGHDIKKYVEKYKGSFSISLQGEEEFPVTYILSFPIIKPDNDEI